MSKKKRSLLQKLIIFSIFFNFTAALSDADLDLYQKYKHMLKRFATRPPSPNAAKDKVKDYLKTLNIYETLQLKPDDHRLEMDDQQSTLTKPVENKPPEALDNKQNKDPPSKKIEELSALSQSSQNYGNQDVPDNVNFWSPSQSYALPSQPANQAEPLTLNQNYPPLFQNYGNQAEPSTLNQNYAPLSQSYANQALTNPNVLPSQFSGNTLLPSNFDQNFASPSLGHVPLTSSQNDALTKYLDYLMVNNDYQNPIETNNNNPSRLIDIVNYNGLANVNPKYAENTQNMMNLNSYLMEPTTPYDHGPATLIDIGELVHQNPPVMGQEMYDSNILNGQDYIPLGILSKNSIKDQDYTPLGIMSQNSMNAQVNSILDIMSPNNMKDEDYVPLSIISQNSINAQENSPLGIMSQSSSNAQENSPLGIMSQNNINAQQYSPLGIMSQNSIKDQGNGPVGIMSQNNMKGVEYSPLGIMTQNIIKAKESSPLGIMTQNNQNQPILSSSKNQKGDDINKFFNENPELYEKLLINGNFMTSLMNKLVMKISEKPKRNRMKKFRNKVTVKRWLPKGLAMQGPVFDEKYQLLYIPLMKMSGENAAAGNRFNSQIPNQFDKLKQHAFIMEAQNKLRQSADVYDPPAAHPDTEDILPPFQNAAPNDPATYTQYMPQYVFTDYWTYEKPLLQDDCPDFALNVAGVCIKYPPFRKFLQ